MYSLYFISPFFFDVCFFRIRIHVPLFCVSPLLCVSSWFVSWFSCIHFALLRLLIATCVSTHRRCFYIPEVHKWGLSCLSSPCYPPFLFIFQNWLYRYPLLLPWWIVQYYAGFPFSPSNMRSSLLYKIGKRSSLRLSYYHSSMFITVFIHDNVPSVSYLSTRWNVCEVRCREAKLGIQY